ncbi:hypothetical protein [Bdellovibrio sp. HCB337]|uniref:hypothetical protein n=1 Tax=Bdellovibrio sp. HCB337 TaxID=3394358 RepID=UPI0039A4D9A9
MFKRLVIQTLIFIGVATPAFAQLQAKWSEGEHLELGLEGSVLACKSLGIPVDKCPSRNVLREDKKYTFQYGEVVTAADYYNNPVEFFTDKKSNIANVIKCAYKQKSAHEDQRNSEIEYPDCNSTGIFGVPGYLEVLSQNYDHFGWNNMVAYVEYHTQALRLAKQAYDLRSTNLVSAKQLFNKAMVFNAFADHYLTDAFASGHIRVPRIQIKRWAKDNLEGPLPLQRGDLLTMFLHNIESRNLRTKKEEGLKVLNSRGDAWVTRGDGNLNLFATDSDLAIIMPKTALAESFKDILIAWEYGDLPEGVFQATQYVPFQNDMPLVEKLSPEYQRVKRQKDVTNLINSGLSMFDKVLFNRGDFNSLLDDLSSIFIQFRRDVAREHAEKADLRKRLPEKYLQSYLNVE